MGWKTVNLAVGVILTLFTIHYFINTTMDWYLLISVILVGAWVLPDYETMGAINSIKLHYQHRVNLNERWFK